MDYEVVSFYFHFLDEGIETQSERIFPMHHNLYGTMLAFQLRSPVLCPLFFVSLAEKKEGLLFSWLDLSLLGQRISR